MSADRVGLVPWTPALSEDSIKFTPHHPLPNRKCNYRFHLLSDAFGTSCLVRNVLKRMTAKIVNQLSYFERTLTEYAQLLLNSNHFD